MTIHPMRGQVVVRELFESSPIWRPDAPRDRRIHRGTVLALGAPARTSRGVEVPFGFGVGDVVLYSFVHNEAAFTCPWTDGGKATWVPQFCVSAVVDDRCEDCGTPTAMGHMVLCPRSDGMRRRQC